MGLSRTIIHNYNDTKDLINEKKLFQFDIELKNLIAQAFNQKQRNTVSLIREFLEKLPLVNHPDIHFDQIARAFNEWQDGADFYLYKDFWMKDPIEALQREGALQDCVLTGLAFLLSPKEKNSLVEQLTVLQNKQNLPCKGLDDVIAAIRGLVQESHYQCDDVRAHLIKTHRLFVKNQVTPRKNIEFNSEKNKIVQDALRCQRKFSELLNKIDQQLLDFAFFKKLHYWVYSFSLSKKTCYQDCIDYANERFEFVKSTEFAYEREKKMLYTNFLKKIHCMADLIAAAENKHFMMLVSNRCNFISAWGKSKDIEKMQSWGYKIVLDAFKCFLSFSQSKEGLIKELTLCRALIDTLHLEEYQECMKELEHYLQIDDQSKFKQKLRISIIKLEHENQLRIVKNKSNRIDQSLIKIMKIEQEKNGDKIEKNEENKKIIHSFFSSLHKGVNQRRLIKSGKRNAIVTEEACNQITHCVHDLVDSLPRFLSLDEKKRQMEITQNKIFAIAQRCKDKEITQVIYEPKNKLI